MPLEIDPESLTHLALRDALDQTSGQRQIRLFRQQSRLPGEALVW